MEEAMAGEAEEVEDEGDGQPGSCSTGCCPPCGSTYWPCRPRLAAPSVPPKRRV
uniref:Uncharacterized protein n=1 Tax=Oryza nivara TaxID=4536 RepID=A0A0E0G4B1_ORYNI